MVESYTDYLDSKGSLPLHSLDFPIVQSIERFLSGISMGDYSVLEFGCGRLKPLKRVIESNGGHYECMDLDSKAEPDYLGLPDKFFDLVVSRDVLEHLNFQELEDFLSWASTHSANHVHETTNPFSPHGVGGFYGDKTHKQLYNPRMLGEFFKAHGFKDLTFFRVAANNPFLRDSIARFLGFDICPSYLIMAEK